LDDVVGLETGFHLLTQIQEAYATGQRRRINYDIAYERSVRIYEGELIPVAGTDSVMIFCCHIAERSSS